MLVAAVWPEDEEAIGRACHHLPTVINPECLHYQIGLRLEAYPSQWALSSTTTRASGLRAAPQPVGGDTERSESVLSLFVGTTFGSRGPFRKRKPRRMIKSADVLDERV